MQAAFLLYEGFTPLDLIGPFQVLRATPGIEPVFVAEHPGSVASDGPPATCSRDSVRSPSPNAW